MVLRHLNPIVSHANKCLFRRGITTSLSRGPGGRGKKSREAMGPPYRPILIRPLNAIVSIGFHPRNQRFSSKCRWGKSKRAFYGED